MVLTGATSVLRFPGSSQARCRHLYGWPHFWSDQVSSAQEFYDHADEHFGWAETAKTERERAIFLQMAAAWLEVAQNWECGATLEKPD
jgi:hypothetical protein